MSTPSDNSKKLASPEGPAISAEGLTPICGKTLGANETARITARNAAVAAVAAVAAAAVTTGTTGAAR
jgi:hypothetical protein